MYEVEAPLEDIGHGIVVQHPARLKRVVENKKPAKILEDDPKDIFE